eukprot:scaffold6420_cov168-Amphora_coffeaeformis.AAC.37
MNAANLHRDFYLGFHVTMSVDETPPPVHSTRARRSQACANVPPWRKDFRVTSLAFSDPIKHAYLQSCII